MGVVPVSSYVRLVQGQQAKQAQLLATLGDELQVLLGKMSTATEMLVTTPAVRALAAKHREMDKLKRKIEAKVEKQCDALREQLQVPGGQRWEGEGGVQCRTLGCKELGFESYVGALCYEI